MPNLPNFDFSQRLIETWSSALVAHSNLWNSAWLKITDRDKTYSFKEWLADAANSLQLSQDAIRDLSRFDTGRVDWHQVPIQPGQTKEVSFDVSLGIKQADQIRVTKAAALGGEPHGSVTVLVKDLQDRRLQLSVTADKGVADGDQWIAFAYQLRAPGPPLGIILVLIENPEPKPVEPAETALRNLSGG